MQTVADIVERVKALTLEEMEEIENIISKRLVEKKDNCFMNNTSRH